MTAQRFGTFGLAGLLAVVLSTGGGTVLGQSSGNGAEADYRQHVSDLREAAGAARRGGVPGAAVTSTTSVVFGIATDFFVPGDYDGDGKADHAIWRPGGVGFKVRQSSDASQMDIVLGQTGDDPTVIGDYDGDGRGDAAVYRAGASAGLYSTWIYHSSATDSDVTVTCSAGTDCGKNGDFPAPGDYNGDGKFDFAVQRAHTGGACATDNSQSLSNPFTPTADFLIVLNGATTATTVTCVGQNTNVVVPGDYDGDGVTDLAVWRTGTPGRFFVHPIVGGPNFQWVLGQPGDYPVANFNSH